jgi:hypothetical protein
MKIERAVQEQGFVLISISGPSGSGKTYSALQLARGLVGPDGEIGLIDAENKRSRYYAGVAGGFHVLDLTPPFTPQRYVEAVQEFEAAGFKVVVIDSASHEWEGTGGILEQAEAIEQAAKKSGLNSWAKPKAAHRKFMNALLQARMHLIFCCRVKEKHAQVKINGKTEIVNEGFVAIQEKGFIYEMTLSMMLAEGTNLPTITKCPEGLRHIFQTPRRIDPEIGAMVRKWAEEGKALDPEYEAKKREGLEIAQGGTAGLLEWWSNLGQWQKRLVGDKEEFKSIAAAADQINNDIQEADGSTTVADRLAAAREASGHTSSGEGFSHKHVKTELKSSAERVSVDGSAGSETPPPNPALGAEQSAAADLGGDGEAGEQLDLPDASPPASPFTEEEDTWLKDVAKYLWAVTKPGAPAQAVRDQVEQIVEHATSETISKDARDYACELRDICINICERKVSLEDGKAKLIDASGVKSEELL